MAFYKPYLSTILISLFCSLYTFAGGVEEHLQNLENAPTSSGSFPKSPFKDNKVTYKVVNGLAIFEGDIILGPASAPGKVAQKSLIHSNIGRRWPNSLIPYTIDSGLSQDSVNEINAAINHVEIKTNLAFVLRTEDNAGAYPDFVTFRPGDGCSSGVGRTGGEQFINLAENCSYGNTIHEIGHAAGLWHEHSRANREDFIEINYDAICPDYLHAYDLHDIDGENIGPYDFGSIMHYPVDAFSCNGEDTIIPIIEVPKGVTIGQRKGLSFGDKAGINAMYPERGESPDWHTIADFDTKFDLVDFSQHPSTITWPWIRDANGTPSNGTGPSSGSHNSDYYMYFETSNGYANKKSDRATIYLIPFDGQALHFSYHMYGSDTGMLMVELWNEHVSRHDIIFLRSGQVQSSSDDKWIHTSIDLTRTPGKKRVRITAYAEGGFKGDIAIDEIRYTNR